MTVSELQEAVDAIGRMVAGLDIDTFAGADARRLADLFTRGERLCAAGKMLAARRVSDCSAWTGGGARSPEEWLAGLSGTTLGVATALLDTAERVVDQPSLQEALKAGDVSLAQAEEISRAVQAVAESDPGAEDRLVGQARNGASMRELSKQCRQVVNSAGSREQDRARAERLRQQRYFKTWVDADGAGHGRFQMAPGDYARFMALFKPFQDHVFAGARKDGRYESYCAYAADGLLKMAEAAHAGSGGHDREGRSNKVRVPATVIALADLAALRRGAAHPEETCEIVGVGPVPVSEVAGFLSDAVVAAAIVDGTDIRRVVHLGRQATALQRTALWVRDRACVHCGSLHNLEIDHVDEWSGTRRTHLDRLAFLCRRCHHLKSYRGWRLVGDPGGYKLVPPPPPDP